MLTRAGTAARGGVTIALLGTISMVAFSPVAFAAPPDCPPADPACDVLPPDPGGGDGPAPPAPPPPPPPAIDIAIGLSNGLGPPVPNPHTTPKSPTYVRVKTSFWVNPAVWQNLPRITGGLANEQVSVWATHDKLTWTVGDGSGMTCHGPGSATDLKTCVYTYQQSSVRQRGGKYSVTVTMHWKVHWNCVGGDCPPAPFPDLAPLATTGATTLGVGEIQTGTTAH